MSGMTCSDFENVVVEVARDELARAAVRREAFDHATVCERCSKRLRAEQRLGEVGHPVLVLAGRHDRACTVAAAEVIAGGIPDAELCIFENSAHMMFIEEQAAYVSAIEDFLDRRGARVDRSL